MKDLVNRLQRLGIAEIKQPQKLRGDEWDRPYGPQIVVYSGQSDDGLPARSVLAVLWKGIVGHAYQQVIAEFAIPELVNSTVVAELNMAADPIQPFVTILDRASDGNPEGNNRIGGMLYVSGPKGPGSAAGSRCW